MKKYPFLVPVAAAIGALVGAAPNEASASQSSEALFKPGSKADLHAGSPIDVPTARGDLHSFLLTRSESEGILIAEHQSHSSHASHSSHGSHHSHKSHSSHHSSSGMV